MYLCQPTSMANFMEDNQRLQFLKRVLQNIPESWLQLTTHRLDIYDESRAKTQFLEQFEALYQANNPTTEALLNLPTAYDYIRLGHPLSCVLEWGIAHLQNVPSNQVISFDSQTIPLMAILRTNLLSNRKTLIYHTGELPKCLDVPLLQEVYRYQFELKQVEISTEIHAFDGSTVFLTEHGDVAEMNIQPTVDFYINLHGHLGSVVLVNGDKNKKYVSEIQHVRRRETIAMTPANTLTALQSLVGTSTVAMNASHVETNKSSVINSIAKITKSNTKALVASSGLSMQYAIMMGLVHDAQMHHPNKAIKFIVPPNCYGGTNDQARRVAACLNDVEVVDLLVDGDHDMVSSLDKVLTHIANEDAIPYIIAEIPTNPRVEVPNLKQLREVLSKKRNTAAGKTAVDPVFILDQTFCPNVNFLGEDAILSTVRAISYVSGSKFPSGGRCTAGYCVGNTKTAVLLDKIEQHLLLCDNEATALQYEILAAQLPSMKQRIQDAYLNTRSFVNYIREVLPAAKINFVSEELAAEGFTPSVFSLDLPTKGDTAEERESYKRNLNHKLINLMITEIPDESKYCVSYGQLKGCYWTIPATSTQGTTKEGDKDYIARVALSSNMDLDRHKEVFFQFVNQLVRD